MHSCEYSVGSNDEIVHKLSDPILITVHINPCHFKRRKFLSEQFRDQMQKTKDVELFIVELAYDDNAFEITDKNN